MNIHEIYRFRQGTVVFIGGEYATDCGSYGHVEGFSYNSMKELLVIVRVPVYHMGVTDDITKLSKLISYHPCYLSLAN